MQSALDPLAQRPACDDTMKRHPYRSVLYRPTDVQDRQLRKRRVDAGGVDERVQLEEGDDESRLIGGERVDTAPHRFA